VSREQLSYLTRLLCATTSQALAFGLTLNGCPLRSLRLQHNALGDEGVASLAKALLCNTSLTSLQLADVGCGTRGVGALMRVIDRPALTQCLHSALSTVLDRCIRLVQSSHYGV
jgi:hypothetical protein